MAYAGREPWHGLGQKLPVGADLDTWTKAAGFDWRILRSKVRFAPRRDTAPANYEVIDNQHVLFRSDTLAPLSVVTAAYKIVHPEQVLKYFDQLATDGGFQLETAGTLFGGKQMWALATIGAEARVLDPKDKMLGRLLLATSADGSIATTAKFVIESVVCHNTLTRGLAETGKQVKVRHRINFSADRMNEKLGIALREQFHATMQQLRVLAMAEMPQEDMVRATVELQSNGAAGELKEQELARLARTRAVRRIAHLSTGETSIGADLDGRNSTAWGWLNSVTQFVDHEAESRSDEGRLWRAWWGNGEAMKNRAFGIASRYAGGALEFPKLALSFDGLIEAMNTIPGDAAAMADCGDGEVVT